MAQPPHSLIFYIIRMGKRTTCFFVLRFYVAKKQGATNGNNNQFYSRCIHRHDADLHNSQRKGQTMNKQFWKATGIRAVRTFLQVVLAVWTAGTLITEVDWKMLLLSAISASIYSVLTSLLTGLPEVEYSQHIYMSTDEPADSWIEEEEVQDGEE